MEPNVSYNTKTKVFLIKFWEKNRIAYSFLFPWFIGVLVLGVIPMASSLYLSFTNYDFFTTPDWVGLFNYIDMFTADGRFLKAMSVTFKFVFISVPLQLLFALLLALILNKGIPFLKVFRAVYYVPSLLGSSVAVAILWRQVFGAEGIINVALSVFGIQGVSWLANPNYSIYTLILLRVWQFGSPMVIFLAGLRAIPKPLYEAAKIDGAGKVASFFRITLPLLSPVILFNLIMQIISAFQQFTAAFVIGGVDGGPLDSLLFYTLYLYISGFKYFEMGYASAMAWVLLIIIAAFTAFVFLTAKKWVYYEK